MKKFNLRRYLLAQDLLDKDFEEITKERWRSIESSFIDAVAYYEDPEILEIRLSDGKRYTFRDVPRRVYENFLKSESKGKFFNKFIKNKFKIVNH